MNIDFTASRLAWHNHIARWSNDAAGVLRRRGVGDRPVTACVSVFSPREKQGQAINPEDRKARISALVPGGLPLAPDPDQEQDVLIVFNPDGTEQAPYRIVAKPGREEPVPGLVLFWTLQVRR